MMIVRSRTIAGQAVALATPNVQQALRGWEERVAAARDEGRQAGAQEAAARIAAAEERAAKAEARAAERLKQREAELNDRLGTVIAELERVTRRAGELERQVVQEAEAQCVRLALALAARVLRHEVDTDPGWMEDAVRAALTGLPDKRGVVVRLHPQDAAIARERQKQIAAGVPGLERLVFQDDEQLDRGHCVLMSQGTRIDAGAPGGWERLAVAMDAAVPHPPLAVEDGA
jgi:flagellar assembly protein FliH